jgi:ADP-ribose pyrophosphatase YjhB (NUDIX family)
MKKKLYLSSRIYLINKKFKQNEFYHYFEEPNNVIIIPKIKDTYIIVEQKREPINKKNFEFPMGWIDKGENPLKAANRELREETGYKSLKRLSKFLEFYADPGRGTRTCYCYFIDKLQKCSKPEKGIKIYFKTKKQIIAMIRNKTFNNASHIAAFNYFINKN